MSVPLLMHNGRVVVVVKGKTWNLSPGTSNYVEVIEAIKANQTEDEISELLDSTQTLTDYLQKQGNKRVTVVNNTVYFDGEELHNSIADRIIEFKESNLPIEHLVKFLERVQNNPSYNSRQQLYDFLENKDLVITEDGYFLAYKGVRSDYMDVWSGTISNCPGRTIKMDRSKIDDNPGKHCSKGLHVGAVGYATNWAGDGRVVIVRVDPANVVSVPNDHSFQKCRVCEYTVLRDSEGVMTQALYTTDGNPYKLEEYDGDWDFTDDLVDDEWDDGEVYSYDDEDEDEGVVMKDGVSEYFRWIAEEGVDDDEDLSGPDYPERIDL